MFFAAGASGEIRTRWEERAGGLVMTLEPDGEFLRQAEYPVVIDPTVQSGQTAGNILDALLL